MDKRLETYLQTVENELGGLESEQRENELREMRQHIEAIVARLIEGGLSKGEATEAAIAQFGAARQVGRELNQMRAERDPLWRVLMAVLGVVVVYVGSGSLSPLLQATQNALGMLGWIVPVLIGALASFAVGAFAGFIAPKRGGRAALWTFGIGRLFAISLAFMAIKSLHGNTTTAYFSFLTNSTYLVTQMAMIWFGANFGARRAQNRDLTRV